MGGGSDATKWLRIVQCVTIGSYVVLNCLIARSGIRVVSAIQRIRVGERAAGAIRRPADVTIIFERAVAKYICGRN